MKHVLRQIFGGQIHKPTHHVQKSELDQFPRAGALVVQDDVFHNLRVTAKDARRWFVLGLVRRPCDFALSHWSFDNDRGLGPEETRGSKPPYSSAADIERFAGYLLKRDVSMTHRLKQRYPDPSLTHCWARTHSLVSDVRACVHQFVRCGGNATFSASDWARLEREEQQAPKQTSSHASCEIYFNTTMRARMWAAEGELIQRYKLGSCCSRSR